MKTKLKYLISATFLAIFFFAHISCYVEGDCFGTEKDDHLGISFAYMDENGNNLFEQCPGCYLSMSNMQDSTPATFQKGYSVDMRLTDDLPLLGSHDVSYKIFWDGHVDTLRLIYMVENLPEEDFCSYVFTLNTCLFNDVVSFPQNGIYELIKTNPF